MLMLFPLLGSCHQKEIGFDFSQHRFVIVSNGDVLSAAAADYLYRHFSKRIGQEKTLQIRRADEEVDSFQGGVVYVEIVPDLLHDYQIKNEKAILSLFARDRKTMIWLSYMLIDYIGRFHQGMEVADLFPAYLDFASRVGSFAMSYREPHTYYNSNSDYVGMLGTHTVDSDWGIWGHNMGQVFREEIALESYAWIDGKRNREQFCFSARHTWEALDGFIMDEYGDGQETPMRFMIAPNDNKLVCTCSECHKLGNTEGHATEAVIHLMNKLADRYPNHQFYTLAYLTTNRAPQIEMESNTGVLVSTIDIPKSVILDKNKPSMQAFVKTLDAWKEKTEQVYVWDYSANFDDYMTPYPTLLRLQGQLRYFTDQGVRGIFLNGSGYDYAPLDDMKTYVTAALLYNPSLEVQALVTSYLDRFYPMTAHLLQPYYIAMENESATKNLDIPIYMSFREASGLYFHSDRFKQLYEQLVRVAPDLKGEERARVEKLVTAWSYTYLQVLYHGEYGVGLSERIVKDDDLKQAIAEAVVRLEGYNSYDNMQQYKETKGDISSYIREWRELLQIDRRAYGSFHKLSVKNTREKANELPDGSLLGDRVLGFASDFNQGWFLTGQDIWVEGEVGKQSKKITQVTMRFLVNPRHRMLAPHEVEVFLNGVSQGKLIEKSYQQVGNVVYVRWPLALREGDQLWIHVQKSKEIVNSVIACDEVQLF